MKSDLTVYYTINDVKEFLDETLTIAVKEFYDIFSPELQDKIFRLRELYGYYALVVPCKKATIEYAKFSDQSNVPDIEKISIWAEEYRIFFEEHLMSFGNQYQTEMTSPEKILFLTEHNLYVDLKPLQPVYEFWVIMLDLYWGNASSSTMRS